MKKTSLKLSMIIVCGLIALSMGQVDAARKPTKKLEKPTPTPTKPDKPLPVTPKSHDPCNYNTNKPGGHAPTNLVPADNPLVPGTCEDDLGEEMDWLGAKGMCESLEGKCVLERVTGVGSIEKVGNRTKVVVKCYCKPEPKKTPEPKVTPEPKPTATPSATPSPAKPVK